MELHFETSYTYQFIIIHLLVYITCKHHQICVMKLPQHLQGDGVLHDRNVHWPI